MVFTDPIFRHVFNSQRQRAIDDMKRETEFSRGLVKAADTSVISKNYEVELFDKTWERKTEDSGSLPKK